MNSVFLVQTSLLTTSLVLAVIFFMAWYTMGREKFAFIWGVTFLLVALQRFLNINKDDFESFALYWMIVCFLSMLSVTFGAWGHILRTSSKISVNQLHMATIVMMVITWYFTVIDKHTGLSMSLYIYHNAFLLFVVSFVILRFRARPLPAEIGCALSYFFLGVLQLVAATFALMQGREFDAFYQKMYLYLNFVSLPASYTAMGMFVIFMLASDKADKMKKLAMTDPLTDCLNRRGFYELARENMTSLLNSSQHVCLVYWDIDKFKSINDNYGHAGGDKALTDVVALVQNNIKQRDLLGRLGGEEFIILLGRIEREDAAAVAERLRHIIEITPVEFQGKQISLTSSFGVVFVNEQSVFEHAIDLADDALYQAKENGRNQVVMVT